MYKKTNNPPVRKPNQIRFITIRFLALSIPIGVIGFTVITPTVANSYFSTLNTNGMHDNHDFILTTDIVNVNSASLASINNVLTDNVVINEVMADNDITIPGPDMNYPDWIELYNPGPEPLNISGMYLTDDLINPTKWQFPNSTIIDSDGYLLIWGDGYNTTTGGLYASFRLNANGDTVALFASDGATLIDSVTFRKQIRDTSYGRLPNAGDEWAYLTNPSPGGSNGENLSDGQLPNWVLPLLITLVIFVFIAVIAFRNIILRRDFK